MSQPSIPNITPVITFNRNDAINLLLASIGMEELSLAHIVNAEAEKIQYVLGTLPGIEQQATLEDLLVINQSVQEVLEAVIKKELLLDSKLNHVIKVISSQAIE
ncbi:hypothetical protein E2R51_17395 [Jeotgalibacillus sp. S-D1]|uniref:hypothetical protein n=1 Tax=Jeotgalibacillus sp. S-D1 TaxID=2552189 RepID=UPI00105AAA1F|nr:hypothetical protein [Jeotgalibacillus sp. S-D1]TDL30757.1 hypothetical protein E2R51_17395 [Jeotgalibacillus sp. S-D1]